MLITNNSLDRMRRSGLNIYVVNVYENSVNTYDEWAATQSEYECLENYDDTSEIGDAISGEYAVVAASTAIALTLARAEHYTWVVTVYTDESEMDNEDFDEITDFSEVMSLNFSGEEED